MSSSFSVIFMRHSAFGVWNYSYPDQTKLSATTVPFYDQDVISSIKQLQWSGPYCVTIHSRRFIAA